MKFIRKHIKIVTILIIFILMVGLVILKIYLNNGTDIDINDSNIVEDDINLLENSEEDSELEEIVYVDIKGAVVVPGVYEIESSKKVIDVVNLAGGLKDNADTSLINLAKKVSNEMVIIIYTKEEVENSKKDNTIVKIIDKECVCPEIKNDSCIENNKDGSVSKIEGKVNLNEATLEELLTLNGVGESKAQAIIEYRNEVGRFNSIEEVKNVSGIGEALYDKIKEDITI